jgi:hypothetical protein
LNKPDERSAYAYWGFDSASLRKPASRHRRARATERGHQPVDDLLQALAAGLRDVHVQLGRAHGLVSEDLLDRAQRHAALEQVRRVAVAQRVDGGVFAEPDLVARGHERLL